MSWDIFIYFAALAIAASVLASVFAFLGWRRSAVTCSVASSLILAAFIAGMWISLDRPPLRTMGETRLWYSFFAGAAGLFTYLRWKYKWILSFSAVLSTVFIILNLAKPEIHDQTLMPALQSGWFIPHVTVYMFSYSLLGCAFLIGLVIDLIKQDEMFKPVWDHIDDILDAKKFIGRAPSQTVEFIDAEIQPILEKHANLLGEQGDVKV